MNRLCLISLAVICAALVACGDGDPRWTPRPLVAALSRVESCEELLTSLREDASVKVRDEAARMKMSYHDYSRDFFGGGAIGADAGAGGVPESDGTDAPSHYTDTNTQVAGVDEPDFVKTDGLRIFLVHGRRVEVFSSWPAEETALIGSIEVEGEPVSMFLEGDQLVVYSQLYFADQASDAGSSAPPEFGLAGDVWGPYYPYSYRPFTKLTVLDVTSNEPVVTHQRYVEGSFRDARRHGDVVRTLIQAPTWEPRWSGGDYPSQWAPDGKPYSKVTYYGLVNAWLERRLDEIESRELSDFLPDEFVVAGGEYVAVEPRCDRFYAPEPGQATYGMTVALTTDLSDLGTDESLFVLGEPSVVYASHDALVLAHYDWSWFGMGWMEQQRTVLHAFAIDEASTTYAGSGIVPGFVDDQFAFDEKDGVFRVALTETVVQDDSWGTTVSRVHTLAVRDGSLVELGRSVDLAPGERIFATRYVGDKAYVVTFRQVDPLFVIDLADPSSPTLLGELKIPGFSTYMHPLSETHLLTIGRGGDDVGFDLGMQLQIFDVSDPAHPTQVQSHLIEGYSPAENDHKAFVFDPITNLLAVPVDEYGASFVSSLRLFHVSIEGGFTEAGSIDHSPLFDECVTYDGYSYYYGCAYGSSMRRGLFIDDYVYAISFGGLTVHALSDLVTPLVVEPLPAPEFYASPYWFEGDPVLF